MAEGGERMALPYAYMLAAYGDEGGAQEDACVAPRGRAMGAPISLASVRASAGLELPSIGSPALHRRGGAGVEADLGPRRGRCVRAHRRCRAAI